jgi:superfamily II DNA or RNA helicase
VIQVDFNIETLTLEERKQVLIVTLKSCFMYCEINPELSEKIGLLIYDEGHHV